MKNKLVRQLSIAGIVAGAAFAGAQDINVQVNGEDVNFRNQAPVYIGGRVLVPLRGVFEKMGASVDWKPKTRTVMAMKGSTEVKLVIGEQSAMIDNKSWTMDVPAQIINGSTMVPIRFVSEALGAQVGWNSAMQLVTITANPGNGGTPDPDPNPRPRPNPPRPIPPRPIPPRPIPPRPVPPRPIPPRPVPPVVKKFVLPRGTVIPAKLMNRVSSQTARRGDRVRAVVQDFRSGPIDWNTNRWDFPANTIIEGRVTNVVRHTGQQPGLIELTFNKITLPNGRSVQINASIMALDDRHVARNSDGLYVANNNNQDNRLVYAGYGAGAGLLLGLASDKPLEGAGLGAIIGLIAGSVEQSQRKTTRDVVLEPGTRFGVRLNRDITVPLVR